MPPFDEAQLALIEKVARSTAEEMLRLHNASIREEARKIASDAANDAATLLALQVKQAAHEDAKTTAREAVAEHARACMVKVELWKLLVLSGISALGGGGVLKLLGG